MRVLVDECVDWPDCARVTSARREDCQTAWMGRSRRRVASRATAAEFDIFITVDTKQPYQQNIAALDIAVVVLRGRTTRLADLRELLDRLREALNTARRGEVTIIGWLDS